MATDPQAMTDKGPRYGVRPPGDGVRTAEGLTAAWEAHWHGTYRVPPEFRTEQCRRETERIHRDHRVFAEGYLAALSALDLRAWWRSLSDEERREYISLAEWAKEGPKP